MRYLPSALTRRGEIPKPPRLRITEFQKQPLNSDILLPGSRVPAIFQSLPTVTTAAFASDA